ncbi:radical SAM/SPASM domain-containing protein [Streptomyces sp. 8N706]|uniref:radical SAM/SPASM domain-containing protein n=1 Tax=Streptomyces sp. 8N706 TaxID=3457416 RepID=UPI003FCFBD42
MAFKTIETNGTGTGHLKAVEIGVTARCNFRCSYCGAYDLTEKKLLSPTDVFGVLDNLPDLERVKLSGGEVLLQFDSCVEIIRYATARGLETQVNTNGTLLDEDRFAQLEDAGLGVMHFSLNHTDAARHSAFYGVKERFFDKIVEAIERAVASPSIEAVVETILFDETRDAMTDIHRFVADRGVTLHEIQMEIPSMHEGYSSTLPREEILQVIGDVVRNRDPRTTLYFSCLSAYFGASGEAWKTLRPLFSDPGVINSTCIEGKAQLHVHSNGDVMICELGCPEVIGNVFQDNLLTLFNENTRLQEFIHKKHDEQTFSCFRMQEDASKKKEPVLLPMPRF